MKEIGGYFGLEHFGGEEYHSDLLAVNNGRNALLYLLKARHIKKLYLPYFLCDSVSNLCDRYGYSYEYYSIDENFMPVFHKCLESDEFLYVVNFYGQISNCQVHSLKEKYGNIIFDNIHAFYQKPVENVDTIYSCRKFFGVPDGGYLSTTAVLPENLPKDVSMGRMRHILGRFEGNASDYYKDFKENDHSFTELELRRMSDLTHNLLRAVDYDAIRHKRNENYAVLERYLSAENPLRLTAPDGPYCYPFYCKNGMQVKKLLAQSKIYVATLWPNVLEMNVALEVDYAENILPLPCDQRYDEADMLRICSVLKDIKNKDPQ